MHSTFFNYLSSCLFFSFLQKIDSDDYRLVRFMDKKKLVKASFAQDLIAAVPPTEREERVVFCNGGGGPLGNPKVYINLVSRNSTQSTTSKS
jgi:NADH dehydrogenase (ubiquinone) Fe-S protein 6